MGMPDRPRAAPRPSPAQRRRSAAGWFPSRTTVFCAAVLAVTAGALSALLWTPAASRRGAEYADLRSISAGEVAGLAASVPDGGYGLSEVEWATREVAAAKPLHERLRSMGPRVGFVAAAMWLDGDAALERGVTKTGDPEDDFAYQPVAWWLRERADARLDAVLLRMVADRSLRLETRIPPLVVLCRPGNAAAMGPLVDAALDEGQSADLRRQVLFRLGRIGARPPERLRELLASPAHDLDRMAAAVLCAAGDREAPTLVLRTLRRMADAPRRILFDRTELGLALDAAAAIPDDPRLAADASAALAERSRVRHRVLDPAPAAFAESLGHVADGLAAWIERQAETAPSDWERARWEYLGSERRRRELRFRTFDEIEAAPESEIDVAAAALFLVHEPEVAEELLEDLDRTARGLQPRIADAADPREKLRRMRDLLVPRQQSAPWGMDESDVSSTLRHRSGNCMGWTLTFVALGDRMGLPLHAVALPEHVFVRWDDGRTTLDFDPTLLDPFPEREDGDPGGLRGTGRYLRNLTRRELLSLRLSNASAHLRQESPTPPARSPTFAEQAHRLDPENVQAAMNRAAEMAEKRPSRAAEVRLLLEDAAALPGFVRGYTAACASSLVNAGAPDEALAFLDRHDDGSWPDARRDLVRADALCRLGRYSEATPLLERLSHDGGASVLVRCLRVSAAFAKGEVTARREFDAAVESGLMPAAMALAAAARILGDPPYSAERARFALSLLEPLGDGNAGTGRPRALHLVGPRRLGLFDGEKRRLAELREEASSRLVESDAGEEAPPRGR